MCFSASKNCLCYQGLNHNHPPSMVHHPWGAYAQPADDAMRCHNTVELNLWHAGICHWVPQSPGVDHWKSKDEAETVWADGGGLGNRNSTLRSSRCTIMPYHLIIDWPCPTDFQGCHLILLMWHPQHCYCDTCHGPPRQTSHQHNTQSKVPCINQGHHCYWEENSQPVLQQNRSLRSLLHCNGYKFCSNLLTNLLS